MIACCVSRAAYHISKRPGSWGLAVGLLCLALVAAGRASPAARPPAGQPDLQFPFMGTWRIIQGYGIDDAGNPVQGTHYGTYALDFVRLDGPTKGETVYAAHSGTIVAVGRHPAHGGYVRIADRADPGYTTYYLHLAALYEGIVQGAKVEAGTPLGVLGYCAGANSSQPCTDHLHFALSYNGTPVKPEPMGGMSGFRYGLTCTGCTNDDQPPTITFAEKPESGLWYNEDRRITWHISDRGGCGVRSFAWAWDQRPKPGTEQPGASGETRLSSAGEGMHTLYIVAWDSVGNKASTVLSSLGYDMTPPETYMDSASQEFSSNELITIYWRGWDYIEGPAYQYSHYLGGVEDWTPWMASTQASYANLPPGSYTFYVKAKDRAGNEDPTPATLNFTVK
jgi:hypothetical protein